MVTRGHFTKVVEPSSGCLLKVGKYSGRFPKDILPIHNGYFKHSLPKGYCPAQLLHILGGW